ncbi:MAG: hypothetical protein F6K62_03225 [Sphaerospermopsis sp. SIO1G2]|nr:hypothetical protein [Sphaerospermopsis sp. SIO1G2]
MFIKNLLAAAGAVVVGLSFTASAQAVSLISIDWDTDTTTDGIASGTLGGFDVTLTSTDGNVNGGIAATFATNWTNSRNTNDVPGVSDPGLIQEAAAIDWLPDETGFVNLTLGGAQVIDPILLFSFADGVTQSFDFADNLTLSILDESPVGSTTIAAGNVVTTNGSGSNQLGDGFAVQLTGTFSEINFQTNVLNLEGDSLGFSLFVLEDNLLDNNQAVPVPEPISVLSVLAVGAVAASTTLKRKQS